MNDRFPYDMAPREALVEPFVEQKTQRLRRITSRSKICSSHQLLPSQVEHLLKWSTNVRVGKNGMYTVDLIFVGLLGMVPSSICSVVHRLLLWRTKSTVQET